MDRPDLPLNGLRAFEVAARQGSFTRAAIELRVTQAAVSQQIRRLEDLLGVTLFNRASTGLVLTGEGAALHPVLTRNLDQIGAMLDRFRDGRYRETLHLGVVTTFATGWLIERLPDFQAAHPGISLRVFTNNNRTEITREGLHMAIRFGDGVWPGLDSVPLLDAPMSPFCAPDLAAQLHQPPDLAGFTLLRSYRSDEWPGWFDAAGAPCPDIEGPVLDSSVALAELAMSGLGVAMLPVPMFTRHIVAGRLMRPFATELRNGRYWLTWPRAKPLSAGMQILRDWLADAAARAG
ncbi:MAG: LysR substrate-binding domain-containing protein [Pseudomonadota bacterium]|nr:LysR family transcriptional regulator [Roseovarius sp. EGI FJ00037]